MEQSRYVRVRITLTYIQVVHFLYYIDIEIQNDFILTIYTYVFAYYTVIHI